jgi:hypothetical protein
MNKNDKMTMGRREFLGAAAAALFAGVTVQILGCDDGTTSDGNLPAGAIKAYTDTVNGHTHSGFITKVQLDAAADDTVVEVSGSGHTHTVTLTGAEVLSIKAGTHIMRPSSVTGGHQHQVMFN